MATSAEAMAEYEFGDPTFSTGFRVTEHVRFGFNPALFASSQFPVCPAPLAHFHLFVLLCGFQVPGYTGFIPKIQNNFATTYTCASRVAMCCPPTPDLETIQIDYTRARRRLQTSA